MVKKSSLGKAAFVALGLGVGGSAIASTPSLSSADAYIDSVYTSFVRTDVNPIASLNESYNQFIGAMGNRNDTTDDNRVKMYKMLDALKADASSVADTLYTVHFKSQSSIDEFRKISSGLEEFSDFYRELHKKGKKNFEKLKSELGPDSLQTPQTRKDSSDLIRCLDNNLDQVDTTYQKIKDVSNYLDSLTFKRDGFSKPRKFSVLGKDYLPGVFVLLNQDYINAKSYIKNSDQLEEFKSDFLNPQMKLISSEVGEFAENYSNPSKVKKLVENLPNSICNNLVPSDLKTDRAGLAKFKIQVDSLRGIEPKTPKFSSKPKNQKTNFDGWNFKKVLNGLEDVFDDMGVYVGVESGRRGAWENEGQFSGSIIGGYDFGPLSVSGDVGRSTNVHAMDRESFPSRLGITAFAKRDFTDVYNLGLNGELKIGPVLNTSLIVGYRFDTEIHNDSWTQGTRKNGELRGMVSGSDVKTINKKVPYLGVQFNTSKNTAVLVKAGRGFGKAGFEWKFHGGKRR